MIKIIDKEQLETLLSGKVLEILNDGENKVSIVLNLSDIKNLDK